jgi:hypothetical protein
MAINACSINGFTLNGRKCTNKFALLVPILHPPIPTPIEGTNPRVLRDTHEWPRNFEIEDEKHLTFEQPIVTVTAEFLGSTGQDTQDMNASHVDFVTVTGFEVQSVSEDLPIDLVAVNITDFTFE